VVKPPFWTTSTLGELCDLVKGKTGIKRCSAGPYPLVTTGEEHRSADHFQFDNEVVCVPMISSTGHGHASLKRIHFIAGKFALANLLTGLIVRDRQTILPQFLAMFLNYYKDQLIVPLMVGAANMSLTVSRLAAVRVHFPSTGVQSAIIQILREAEEIRDARARADRLSEDLNPSIFDAMFRDIHTRPGEELRTVAEVVSGVAKGRRFSGSQPVHVPYLRVANVQAGYLDLTELKMIDALPSEIEELALRRGDILLTEGGDFDKLGRGALWDHDIPNVIHQNHIFRVRLDRSRLDPIFFCNYLQTPSARSYFLRCGKQTTNLASINMGQLRRLPVPIPPLTAQEEFAERVVAVRELHARQADSRQQIDALHQSLLQQAFQGSLCPPVAAGTSAVAVPTACPLQMASSIAATYMTDAEITAAVIVELKAQGRPLTEFFVQKHMFVLKHREGLPIASQFRRKRAGPWSHELKQKAFFSGTKHNWFSQGDSTVTPGRSIEVGVNKARDFLGDRFDRIAAVVSDLVKFGTTGLERWTTVLKAVLDLRDADKLVTVNTIQAEIDAWPDKREKQAFTEESVEQTIVNMTRRGWLKLDA
jgi:type I restriction enzyme S subunit